MHFIDALDRRNTRKSSVLRLRQFKVVSVQSGSVTIDDGVDVAGIKYLASYSPTVNDVVWAVVTESDILILGKLA